MRYPALVCLLAVACTRNADSPTIEEVAAKLRLPVDELQALRKKKVMSNEELLTMPRAVLDEQIDKLRRPTGAGDAISWRLSTMRDEAGRVPHDAELSAQAQVAALAREGTAGGLSSDLWIDRGPGTIGGRVRGLAIHPTIPSILLCGGVAGGIWRSTDSGASWKRVDDLMENLAITGVYFQRSDPRIVYASTGEGFGNGDSIRGAGIFKSTDTGLTFTRLPSTNTTDFYFVNRLALSADGSVLIAATGTGIFRSIDGGATWSLRSPGRCLDVKMKKADPNLLVAHTGATANGRYSTDAGVSWNSATGLSNGGGRRIEFAWSEGYTGAGNGVVYALAEVGSQLFRSVDGGQSYSLVSTNSMLGSQGWYDNALWVAPFPANGSVQDDLVVAGGIDLWRSTNGGSTFTKISVWSSWPTSAHADHHAIVEHPGYDGTTNRQVWFGNDGGVWRTADVTTVSQLSGWVRRNTGLGITQFYGASTHPATQIIVGGTQDNGTPRRDVNTGYDNWSVMQGGDGGFCASDPTDSRYHYGEYQRGVLRRSTNGGISASTVRNFGSDGPLFIAPFILDPNDPNRLLFGARQLWRSNDIKAGSPAWASIKPSLGSQISAIAVAQGNPDIVWVGHNSGDVYRATNGTAAAPTWVQRDTTTPALPNRYVTRIVIDPRNSNRVFVCLGGYSTGNIYRTTDGGNTWAVLPGLPAVPVRDLEISPFDSRVLFAGTGAGLLVSENDGQSWTSTATPARVSIDEMFWGANNRLYLATHGRGIFEQQVQAPATPGAVVYYRFDEGAGILAEDRARGSSTTIVHGGTPNTDPWATPGRFGAAMLRGTDPTAAGHFAYCNTGWRGPLAGDMTVSWWMKQRFSPGTGISDLWGGMPDLHCFTGGTAGPNLILRTSAGDLVMPMVGANLRFRATAANGVCVAVAIDNTNRRAQWYVDGFPHGAPVPFNGAVTVAAGNAPLLIGRHQSDQTASAYDLDEFLVLNRLATPDEVQAWCAGPQSLHLKFDKGQGDLAVNYGESRAPVRVSSVGAAPWGPSSPFGPATLRGSDNTTASDAASCDTGFRGPVHGDFTVSWWMRERFNPPGASVSHLWGGLGNLRCYTGGGAGQGLAIEGWSGTHVLRMPVSGATLQTRARAAGGVCVSVSVEAATGSAQWYVDGSPHGAPVSVPGGAAVAASGRALQVGRHASDVDGSKYDIDEFHFENYAATRTEVLNWCRTTLRKAAVGRYGNVCGLELGTRGDTPYLGNADYAHTLRVLQPAPTNCLFVVGVTPRLPFDMGIVFGRLSGCAWHVSFEGQLVIPTTAQGEVTIPSPIPGGGALAGLRVDAQVLGFNAGGEVQSNAVSHVLEFVR